MYMVDELKRFNRTAVIGILPRLSASSHALSKAIGVNERLEDMCTPLGVRFVDPYNVFYGRADLYLPDGVLLNKRGKEVFGDMVNQILYRVVRSTHVVREGRQLNDSDAPEVTPIEVTPPLEKRPVGSPVSQPKWFTREIAATIRKRKAAYRQFKRTAVLIFPPKLPTQHSYSRFPPKVVPAKSYDLQYNFHFCSAFDSSVGRAVDCSGFQDSRHP
ncbi:hypothetical protein Pcinc_036536 [Petrolisthes cinctipes]|uniref:Uncharacterized protein n=1 Tax=Petrolisthes cinctipes TaxID=88211 RepID=A0AAE1EPH3_PETCI|nr:hypothetical protein Pcinc_036536 [Petrolisthes cinctipes]